MIGREEVWVNLPDSAEVVVAEPRLKLSSMGQDEIINLTRNLIKPYLKEFLDESGRVTVVIDDHKRLQTPTSTILKAICSELRESGVDWAKIFILMATGCHEKPSSEMIARKLGDLADKLSSKLKVHDCLDKSELDFIGFTKFGTPVWVNELITDSSLIIGVGGIKPHPWAGFSGGCKIILPGVSAWESIGANHLLAVSNKCRVGLIDQNTFRIDVEEAGLEAGLKLIVNSVLNERGETVGLVVGDPINAHRVGAELSRRIFESEVSDKADALIASFGPNDSTLWHIIGNGFFLSQASELIREDGELILVARCNEGVYVYGKGVHHLNYEGSFKGHQELIDAIRSGLDPSEIISETIRGKIAYPELGVKGYLLSELIRRVRISIYSPGLIEEDLSWLGDKVKNLSELSKKLSELRNKIVYVMPWMGMFRAYFRIKKGLNK